MNNALVFSNADCTDRPDEYSCLIKGVVTFV